MPSHHDERERYFFLWVVISQKKNPSKHSSHSRHHHHHSSKERDSRSDRERTRSKSRREERKSEKHHEERSERQQEKREEERKRSQSRSTSKDHKHSSPKAEPLPEPQNATEKRSSEVQVTVEAPESKKRKVDVSVPQISNSLPEHPVIASTELHQDVPEHEEHVVIKLADPQSAAEPTVNEEEQREARRREWRRIAQSSAVTPPPSQSPRVSPPPSSPPPPLSPPKLRESTELMGKEQRRGIGIFSNLAVGDLFGSSSSSSSASTTSLTATENTLFQTLNDDIDGYLKCVSGDVIANRYEVVGNGGKGVFGNVIRAIDKRENNNRVAIKVIRNNDAMKEAGQREIKLLRLLREKGGEKRHIVKMLNDFVVDEHLCIVFEELDKNLRDLLRQEGYRGLNVAAVTLYAAQLTRALCFTHRAGYIHADVKPDNILVTAKRGEVKLCDFGSAIPEHEAEIAEELGSRFYRPPEAILGLPFSYGVDIWALGCVVYELFTGKITFSGRTNNEMLKCFMELRGKFSKKLLTKGKFTLKHFDTDYTTFLKEEYDPQTHAVLKTTRVIYSLPTKDLMQLLKKYGGKLTEAEEAKVTQMKDFIEKCFIYDTAKRLTAEQLLNHPFLK